MSNSCYIKRNPKQAKREDSNRERLKSRGEADRNCRGGRWRKRMHDNRHLHSTEALAISTDEGYEILSTAPISHRPFSGAVVIPSLVHLKHIVLVFLVPECYKVADVESVVVGPESVVEARVPPTIGTDNVVGGGGYGGDEVSLEGKMSSDAKPNSGGNVGGGFRSKVNFYLHSGDKKHVFIGLTLITAVFSVPWFFMNRGHSGSAVLCVKLESWCY
ncbi:hypothetical protein V8G54_002724 [Vigna mungo]|uniref:Uncharacterized protein n=1 Tax=Vigna mungo TaxID=3915 RepID=A0AAQ3P9B3_VIGMU